MRRQPNILIMPYEAIGYFPMHHVEAWFAYPGEREIRAIRLCSSGNTRGS